MAQRQIWRGHLHLQLYWIALALVCLASVIPIAVGTLLPFHDILFHTARMVILTNYEDFRPWWSLDWSPIPDLSLDLLVPPIARLIGVMEAVKLHVGLAIVMSITGTVALHRTLWGRYEWWPFISSLFVYNWMLVYGFENYVFTVGLMMWALATWFSLQGRGTAQAITGIIWTSFLYYNHLHPLAMYGFVIGVHEIETRIRSQRRDPLITWVSYTALRVVPQFVLPAVMLMHRHHEASISVFEYSARGKVLPLLTLWVTGNFPCDILVTAVGCSLLIFMITRGLVSIRHPYVLGAILILPLVMPTKIIGSDYADTRTVVEVAFIALALTGPSTLLVGRTALAVTTMIVMMVFVRIWGLTQDVLIANRTYEPILATYDRVEPGGILFSATTLRKDQIWYIPGKWALPWHRDDTAPLHELGAMAARAKVFVPEMTASIGEQPVIIKDKYRSLLGLGHSGSSEKPYFPAPVTQVESQEELRGYVERVSCTARQSGFQKAYLDLTDYYDSIPRTAIGKEPIYTGHKYTIWDVTDQCRS